MSLSICVLTYNGTDKLHRCLSSLYEYCDQLVVCVDDKTTDISRDIALKYTSSVHTITFEHWGQARDAMIGLAAGDWILQIDDDEDISREDAMFLRQFCASSPLDVDLYKLARKNWATLDRSKEYVIPDGNRCRYLSCYPQFPDYQLRLFRNVPYIRYGRAFAHAAPSGAKKVEVAPFTINHYRMVYADNSWVAQRERMYDTLYRKYSNMSYAEFIYKYVNSDIDVQCESQLPEP